MRSSILPVCVLLVVLCVACKKKPETRVIKTTISVPTVRHGTQALSSDTTEARFTWRGRSCHSVSLRLSDPSQERVTDSEGNKYYGTTVRLTISSSSDTLFDRIFSTADFTAFMNSNYVRPGGCVLLAIAFKEVTAGGTAVFVATVGSPDDMDDEFVLVELHVSPTGTVTMTQVEELE